MPPPAEPVLRAPGIARRPHLHAEGAPKALGRRHYGTVAGSANRGEAVVSWPATQDTTGEAVGWREVGAPRYNPAPQMSEGELLPTADRLLALVDAMAGQPGLMLVDLVADVFITGAPKRLSREAPVLILAFEEERLAPGGGANAVANVAALGGRPLPLGVLGDDAHGERLRAALAALGVPTAGLLVRSGFRTPTKVRILGGGRHQAKQQIVRYDVEDTLELSGEERGRFAAALAGWRGGARAAIVSDYGYGAAEPSLLAPLRAALAPGGAVVGDSRYRPGR